ncbi:MAG: sigma-70 family RNA polymerase sigma factor [Saprospiraceae bacterium]
MLRFLRSKVTTFSDEELLSQYCDKADMAALGQLYDRYLELVYGLCLKYLKEEAKAEDAVMNIFEELTQKAAKHDIKQFRSWLYVLAKNFCLMQLRKENKQFQLSYDSDFMQSEAFLHPMDEVVEGDERENKLQGCLDQLSDEQKQCINLFYYQGKSYKEIADMKTEEVGRIRSHIQNGRRNLRICLEANNR